MEELGAVQFELRSSCAEDVGDDAASPCPLWEGRPGPKDSMINTSTYMRLPFKTRNLSLLGYVTHETSWKRY